MYEKYDLSWNWFYICVDLSLYYFAKILLQVGNVNSKSFVGKVLLRIKWKFELTVYFKHGILGKL